MNTRKERFKALWNNFADIDNNNSNNNNNNNNNNTNDPKLNDIRVFSMDIE